MTDETVRLKTIVEKIKSLEKDILIGASERYSDLDPEYSQQFAELKRVTDDLQTSVSCAYVPKHSPEKVKQFVERHKMNRIVELLRNRYPMQNRPGSRATGSQATGPQSAN